MSGGLVGLLGGLFVVVLLVGPWALLTATRLDRLHIRTDAAWAALDAALARRAVVARAVAATECIDPDGAVRLSSAADRAEWAPRAEREGAENELGRLLDDLDRSRLPVGLAVELADAEQRMVLARRVHNDAVRDVLALRRRPPVRWLHLAGTARQPGYFEIAEPSAEVELGPRPVVRPTARVVLVDAAGRVLLFNGHDPEQPAESFWFTVGGGLEADEELRSAAIRELREETGMGLAPERLTGPVWRRRVRFRFDGVYYDSEEWFFLAMLPGDRQVVDTSGFTELEARTVRRYQWWSADELRHTTETVYPVQLAELLPELLTAEWNGRTRTVH